MENTNKIQFNADEYFKNPEGYTLETRGGVKINRKDLNENKVSNDPKKYPYQYLHPDDILKTITKNGYWKIGAEDVDDLFMIPVTQDIAFTFELFKTGKYDVVHEDGEVSQYAKNIAETIICIWEIKCSVYRMGCYDQLRLRPKQITPYTHPEMYEVSSDGQNWKPIKKYYDFIEGAYYPHKALSFDNDRVKASIYLRLKEQVTIITQQQADEAIKAKYPNYKIQD